MIAPVPRAVAAGFPARVSAGVPVVGAQLLAIHSVLRRLAQARSFLLPASARAAREVVESKAWSLFGYARASDFAREKWARTGHWLYDRAALGELFRCFPRLEHAVTGEDGESPLGAVSALLVGRVATPETLDDWITRARRLTVRALRKEVSQARREPEEPDAVRVKLSMPGAVRVAFEETLDLHRAVVGRHASVAQFLEALIAEGSTSARAGEEAPSPSALTPSWGARDRWTIEARDERPLFASPAFRAALDCLKRAERWVDECLEPAGPASPDAKDMEHAARLERAISELLRLEDEIETRIGELLSELDGHRAWHSFGCEGAAEYGEKYLGLSQTTAWRRASIVRRLRGLGEVRRAYLEGSIGIEAAELIQRALGGPADVTTQQEWLARARTSTLKRLQDEERIALRERLLEGQVPLPSSDDAWHRSLRRIPGRGLLAVMEAGSWVLSSIATGMPNPDVFIRVHVSPEMARDLYAAIEEQRRALAEQAEHLDALSVHQASRARPSLRIASALRKRWGVPAWVGLLGLLEEYACTWDSTPRRAGEKTYERAGYRCEAPGCTSRRNLEEHHIVYRSRRGASNPENLACLCRMHHQMGEHGGWARCRGKAPLGLVWRLGVPQLASWFRNEMRLEPAR